MGYHQTQNYIAPAQVDQYSDQATRQEDLVLDYFQRNANIAFSPETIQRAVLPGAPITSVRRAITNLTNADKLERVGSEGGSFGRPIGTWRFKPPALEGFLF